MKIIFTFLLLISNNALALDYYRTAANVTLFADMLQTIEISKNDNYYETNKILGKNPEQHEVYQYFLSSILLTNIIGEALPDKYGDYFYMSVAIIETRYVLHNYSIGIRVKF